MLLYKEGNYMNKEERFLDSSSTIILGGLLLILGILLIIGRNDFVDILAYAVSLILIIIGIVNSVKNIIWLCSIILFF